jgi:hypothetical protein
MTAECEAKLNVLGFSWVRRHSPAGSFDNNNVLCPDEVASESLMPINRQRTSHDIPTEVGSNDSSWREGDYEGETSSPAADFKKRKVGDLAAITNNDDSTSGRESLDIVNIVVIKWLGDNYVVCKKGRGATS